MTYERKHESYCWEGHVNENRGCKCACHATPTNKLREASERIGEIVGLSVISSLDIVKYDRIESILRETVEEAIEEIAKKLEDGKPHCCEDCPCGYWPDEIRALKP